MKSNEMRHEEFIDKLQGLQVIPQEIKQTIQRKYTHFRAYDWQLGGLLFGIIEQSIIASQNGIYSFLESFRASLAGSRSIQTRNMSQLAAQQNFLMTINQVIEKKDINGLSQKAKDDSQQQIAENILREQLKKSQKFGTYDIYLQGPSYTKDSPNYMSPEIIKYLSEVLETKIILIKYEPNLKGFAFQQFQSNKKNITLTIYSLPKKLIVCLKNRANVNSQDLLGDGFINTLDKQKQQNISQANYSSINGGNLNRTITSIQSNNRNSANSQPFLKVEEMKLCDSCNTAYHYSLLYVNEQCRLQHKFCFYCLKNPKLKQMYCYKQNCSSPINLASVQSFLQNFDKILQKQKIQQQQEKQQYELQQQQQQQLQQQDSKQKLASKYNCVKCNQEIGQEFFYYDNCGHIFCQGCIASKYLDYSKYSFKCQCDECSRQLDPNKIKKFLQEQQESNKNKCVSCSTNYPDQILFNNLPCKHQHCQNCMLQKYDLQKKTTSQMKCMKCFSFIETQNVIKYLNQIEQNRQNSSPIKQNRDINQIKDSQSQSVSFSDSQQISQRILPGQSLQNKQCVKCYKLLPIQNMMISAQCNHYYCLQCITELQRLYQHSQQIMCLSQNCLQKITIEEICNFIISQNNMKQDQNMNVQQQLNNLSDSKSDSQRNFQGQPDESKCYYCKSKLCKQDLFFVKGCQHSICYKCMRKYLNTNQDTINCFDIHCKSTINIDEIEDFHLQHQMMRSQQLSGKGEQKFEVVCSYCKKQDSISSISKPDYFKCSSCLKVTCLVHQGNVPQCRCYCEKCGIQCKVIENTVMCPKCNYSYCMNCKQTEVGNKICQCICKFCGTQLKVSKQLCKCIENVCSICLNAFDNVYLNSSDDSQLRKNQECIHFFCNICYYKKVCSETQNKSYGNLKFQCLFC